jgi:hypothetical protein
MTVSIRLDRLDTYAHCAVFVNGAKAGDLCLRAEEWPAFKDLVEQGAFRCGHVFRSSDVSGENALSRDP